MSGNIITWRNSMKRSSEWKNYVTARHCDLTEHLVNEKM